MPQTIIIKTEPEDKELESRLMDAIINSPKPIVTLRSDGFKVTIEVTKWRSD